MQKPKYHAYVTQEYEQNGDKKTFWTKVGVAFENKNNGLNISIIPGIAVSGKLVLLEPKDDSKQPATPSDPLDFQE